MDRGGRVTSGTEMGAPASSRAAWEGQGGADPSRASAGSLACPHLDSDSWHLDCGRIKVLLF